MSITRGTLEDTFIYGYAKIAVYIHNNNLDKGFWYEGQNRNKSEAIALMHSELSEALEAIRKDFDKPDEHCPAYRSVEVELADCIIRIMDFGIGFNLDIAGALVAKVEYNKTRPYMHGKKF